jgi:Mn-dependent DtxR family transcriptional regulator
MNSGEIDKANQPATNTAPTEPPPLYSERMGLVAIAMGAYHLRHLGRCYQIFNGDFELAIVLGEIGLRHHPGGIGTDHNPTAQSLFDIQTQEQILTITSDPVNTSALSRSTGIPRETVRRKIAGLLQRGWLEATAAGGFTVTERAKDFFGSPFTLDTLNDFLATDERLRQLLELEPEARPPWTAPPTCGAGNRQDTDPSTRLLFSRCVPPVFRDQPGWNTSHLHRLVAHMHDCNLRHLKHLYAIFDGDLLLAIVLGEISHANVNPILTRPDQTFDQSEQLLATTGGNPYNYGRDMAKCNPFSLSEATGIPRETVRRKIARLIRLGWLVRWPQGGYTVTAKPLQQFGPSFNVLRLNDFLDTAARLRVLVAMDRSSDPRDQSS